MIPICAPLSPIVAKCIPRKKVSIMLKLRMKLLKSDSLNIFDFFKFLPVAWKTFVYAAWVFNFYIW